MNNLKNIIFPTATLAGMIIGVGFFSLPYITLKVGLPVILIPLEKLLFSYEPPTGAGIIRVTAGSTLAPRIRQ